MQFQVAAIAFTFASLATQDGWDQARLEAVTEEIRVELEDLRGETFERPVQVRITDGSGFLAHASERIEAMTTPDEWAADQTLAQLLGLIPADYDLLERTYALLEEMVGGFYDPGTDTFYLMEGFEGGLAKVILSHELTHALDDQLYDLDAGMRDRIGNVDGLFAYQALAEGSAQLISMRWVMRHAGVLTQDDIEKASVGTEQLADAPAYLWKPLLASYLEGQKFLAQGYKVSRRKLRGEASHGRTIGEAFAAPPRSSEQILHPEKYWKAEELDEPIAIAHGATPEGWTERSRTTLGELMLAILVEDEDASQAIDMSDPRSIVAVEYTNDAAAGWGGDELLLLEKDGGHLVHLATVWDTSDDAREFRDALSAAKPRICAITDAMGSIGGLRVELEFEARRVTVVSYVDIEPTDVDALLAELDVTVEKRVSEQE